MRDKIVAVDDDEVMCTVIRKEGGGGRRGEEGGGWRGWRGGCPEGKEKEHYSNKIWVRFLFLFIVTSALSGNEHEYTPKLYIHIRRRSWRSKQQ